MSRRESAPEAITSVDPADEPLVAPAVEEPAEVTAPAEPLDIGNWQPTIVEPVAPAPEPEAEAAATAPARPVLPEGSVAVTYRGFADLAGPVVIGGVSYSFRNGQPVTVPSEVAEEVLTWPHEPFDWAPTED